MARLPGALLLGRSLERRERPAQLRLVGVDRERAAELAPRPGTVAAAAPAQEKPKADPIAAPAIQGSAPGDIKYRDRRLLAIYFDMSAMPVPDQLRSLTGEEPCSEAFA